MIKKFLFSIALAIACNIGFASESAELFQLDEAEIKSEFAQLEELEAYVNSNEGITYSTMKPNSILMINLTNSSDPSNLLTSLNEPPLGIPSFLWGLCCSVPGLAVVYFINEDESETEKALIGCAINGAIAALVLFLDFFYI